jgi:hypothetical protein
MSQPNFADERYLPENFAETLLALFVQMGCSPGVVALAFGEAEGLQISYAISHLGEVLAYAGEPLPVDTPGVPEAELKRASLRDLPWEHLKVIATCVRKPQEPGQGLYALTELPSRWRRYAGVLRLSFAPNR